MIHLTLFTCIQYIKFTAVVERAVHITKKKCRNFVVMQRTLSNCLCFTICKRQVKFRFMVVRKYLTVLTGKFIPDTG
jgi:hypothetical protein